MEFYEKLRGSGVQVLDLGENWMALKAEGTQVFLKQDTHWTPVAMQASAAQVVDFLKGRPWFDDLQAGGSFALGESRDIASEGDLVEKLDLPNGSGAFADEVARGVTTVVDGGGNPVAIYDTSSPVVLLGDSFTNIYSDGNMNWGADSGFAQHLARELGMTIDTIAQNGQASTGVRRTLASRPGAAAAMKKKKVVVWAIAARDLFLSETTAREAQVEWKDVEFSGGELEVEPPPTDEGGAGGLRVRARLLTKSSFANPQDVPYPDALYACEYEVEEVLDGTLEAKTIWVFHWAFRDRKLVPSSRHEEGEVREMTLAPFAEQKDLQSVNQANDGFEIPEWWEVEKETPPAEVAGPATEGEASASAPPSAVSEPGHAAQRAGVVAAVYAVLLSGLLVVFARRYGRSRLQGTARSVPAKS